MRVLVVKLGAIGDVIMSLTMVSALRAQDASAHLTWVVGRTSRPVLDLIHGIDEVVTVDEQALLRGGAVDRAREVFALWRRLAWRSFDLVVLGHSDRRYRLLTLPVFAKLRRGFGRTGRAGPLPGRPHGHEYARLITGQDGPEAAVAPLPEIAVKLPGAPFERQPGRCVVVLAPGGARNVLRDDAMRRWPVQSYAALARELVLRDCTTVLVGASHDRDVLPAFSGTPVVDLLGRTTLAELAGVFELADAVVTHDSLALHMAALVRARTVALFGPTSPVEKISVSPIAAAHAQRTRLIWGGARLPCRPCYDGVNYYPCQSNVCMQGISVDEVLRVVDELIQSEPPVLNS